MHGLVQPEAFGIRPIELGIFLRIAAAATRLLRFAGEITQRLGLAGHLARAIQSLELNELRLRAGLDALEQLGQREADPRNDHRPALDAPESIDPFLESVELQDVFDVVIRRLRVDEPFDLHGPPRRLHFRSEACRVLFVVPELVEVVVAGDVLEGVRRLVRAERARGDVGERRLRGGAPGHAAGDEGAERRARRGAHEFAAAEIERLRRDLRRSNVRRLPDDHCASRGVEVRPGYFVQRAALFDGSFAVPPGLSR
jgi:hypothetical protein